VRLPCHPPLGTTGRLTVENGMIDALPTSTCLTSLNSPQAL